MKSFLSEKIREIESNPVLLIYGFFLTLTHALTVAWLAQENYSNLLFEKDLNVCTPLFPFCKNLGLNSPNAAQTWLAIYAALVIATFAALVLKKIRLAWMLSLCLVIGKFFLLSLSQHLTGLGSFAPQVIHLVWLFAPATLDWLRLFLIALSVGAGLSKLNLDWLSGAFLTGTGVTPLKSAVVPLMFAVWLETVLIFGFLSKRRWFRVGLLLLFPIYHLLRIPVFGFYEPLTMILLLSIFALEFILPQENEPSLADRIWSGKFPREELLFFVVLVVCQVWRPSFDFSRRLEDCTMVTSIETATGIQSVSLLQPNPDSRLKCDPVFYWEQLREMCRTNPVENLKFVLYSKKISERDYKIKKEISQVCERKKKILWSEIL